MFRISGYCQLSKTTAKDVSIHSTTIDINRCRFVIYAREILSRIHITESTTTIDISMYET